MNVLGKSLIVGGLVGVVGIAAAIVPAQAQEEAISETAFILNSFSFMVHGFLVMFMAAGFAMLESGLVRTKNTAAICLKNISLYSVAGLMFYFLGYNMLYDAGDGGWVGTLGVWVADDSGDYAGASDWFFQMVFVATTASIVSGTLAERIKILPFLIFTAVLAAFIYPIAANWQWGEGWLYAYGFSDFAGSTIVHSTGGWAALAGAIMLGARRGKYGPDGKVNPIPGANLPLATLGTFILWLGWFGFNGGSQLAIGSRDDVIAIATIYINTNAAAAAGVVAAMVAARALYGKVDLTLALNGALAGLVSITAGPDTPAMWQAILIGGVGGVIVTFAIPALDKLKIDDVVGAISVHLVCGIWGTLVVPWTNADASFGAQLVGVVAIGAFVFLASLAVWAVLKAVMGIRVSEEDEEMGLDKAELGLEAYPEFGRGSQRI